LSSYDQLGLHLDTLKNFSDDRGSLVAITGGSEIPFKIARVFYTFKNAPDIQRGAHAHRSCFQFLVCLSGSMEVIVNDGATERIIHLSTPDKGLLIPPLVWSYQQKYTSDAVCLVLASEVYSKSEYIYDYKEFLTLVEGRN
jgi:dTDP-4-dehydrorhamnose 3,5-epimerase-like enzyme